MCVLAVEAFADLVTEYIKSSIRVLLKDAFRLHQPTTTKVDLKIKGDATTYVFASRSYRAGKLKLVPFSKLISIEGTKEKRSSAATALSRVEIKITGPQGVLSRVQFAVRPPSSRSFMTNTSTQRITYLYTCIRVCIYTYLLICL